MVPVHVPLGREPTHEVRCRARSPLRALRGSTYGGGPGTARPTAVGRFHVPMRVKNVEATHEPDSERASSPLPSPAAH